MTEPLSPTAQAVFNAAWTCPIVLGDHQITRSRQIAAALFAVADQVISSIPPPCEDFDEYAQGFRAAHVKYRNELLAIAAELKTSTTETDD